MFGFTQIGEFLFKCETCGQEVPSGIGNISGHWAECAGKGKVDFVNKVADSSLETKEKMNLIKGEFGVEQ